MSYESNMILACDDKENLNSSDHGIKKVEVINKVTNINLQGLAIYAL